MKIFYNILIFSGAWFLGQVMMYLAAPDIQEREAYGFAIGWWMIFFYSYANKFYFPAILIILGTFCMGYAVLFEFGEIWYHDPPENLIDFLPIILMSGLLIISPIWVAQSVKYIVKMFPEIFSPDR